MGFLHIERVTDLKKKITAINTEATVIHHMRKKDKNESDMQRNRPTTGYYLEDNSQILNPSEMNQRSGVATTGGGMAFWLRSV